MNAIDALKTQLRSGTITKPDFIREALALHRALFDYVDVVGSTDVNEIRINRDGVLFSIGSDDVLLYCPPGEARVAPLEVLNFDRYEPRETAVMDYLSASSRNILDIGANIGWYTARFAKRLPSARIHAFEPLPTSYAYLQRNVAINAVGARVSTYNYGLSSSSGLVQFFVSPTSGTNASLKNVAGATDARQIVCVTMTLDEWSASHEVAPDFIKCDVEGAEFLVFQGGIGVLRAHRPIVFAELLRKWSKPFGYHPTDMIRWFAELGYACWAVGDAEVRPIIEVTDDTPETNYAFLHHAAHAAQIAGMGDLA